MAGGGREIDSAAAREYFMLGYVPAPRTIWKGPRKLRPGHFLRVHWQDEGHAEISEHSYWKLSDVPPASKDDEESVTSKFWDETREAVRLRLISDVPVGLLLSGGLDSTLVAAACSDIHATDVPAYTMGFGDEASDERPFARISAAELGLRHEEFLAEDADIAAVFEELWRGFRRAVRRFLSFADAHSLSGNTEKGKSRRRWRWR